MTVENMWTLGSAGLLNLPPEIFHKILEDRELTKSDLKNIRLAHSRLSRLVARHLFLEIVLDFNHNGTSKKRDEKATRILARLDNLGELAQSFISDYPKLLSVIVPQTLRPSDVAVFSETLSSKLPMILQTFQNVKSVKVDIGLQKSCVQDLNNVLAAVCAQHPGRSIHVGLSGINSSGGWRDTFRSISNIEQLTLRSSTLREITQAVAKDIGEAILNSPKLSKLELHDFSPRLNLIFDQIPSVNMPPIRSLVIHDFDCSSSPELEVISRENLQKFTFLQELEISDYPNPELGSNVWAELGASSNLNISFLKTSVKNTAPLSYLSSPGIASSLQTLEIEVKIDHRNYDDTSAGFMFMLDDDCREIEHMFFHSVLPNIQHDIKHLCFKVGPYLANTGRLLPRESPAPGHFIEDWSFLTVNNSPVKVIEEHIRTYEETIRHFTFTQRDTEYTFKSLETISAHLLFESGSFSSFMRSLRKTPKLRHIDLLIEVVDIDDGGLIMQIEDVFYEVENYIQTGAIYRAGISMTVNVALLRQRVQRAASFLFNGSGWIIAR